MTTTARRVPFLARTRLHRIGWQALATLEREMEKWDEVHAGLLRARNLSTLPDSERRKVGRRLEWLERIRERLQAAGDQLRASLEALQKERSAERFEDVVQALDELQAVGRQAAQGER